MQAPNIPIVIMINFFLRVLAFLLAICMAWQNGFFTDKLQIKYELDEENTDNFYVEIYKQKMKVRDRACCKFWFVNISLSVFTFIN